MTYQDQINAQRAERRAKQREKSKSKVSTEFDDMIPTPGASYVINEAGDEMIVGKRYDANDVADMRWRDKLREELKKEQARIDSIRGANAAEWARAQREREGQMNFRVSNVAAHPPGKTELDAAQRQLDRSRKSLATYTEKDQKDDAARGKEKGIFAQIGSGLTNVTGEDLIDTFAMSGMSIETDTYTAAALEKAHKGEKLSDIEQSLVNAWDLSQNAEQYVANRGGATTANAIGAFGLPMVGYIAETMATGVGGLLQQGAKLGIKSGIEAGIKTGIKVGVQSFGKKLGKAAIFEAARTPLRGSMYRNINERVVDQYSTAENGEILKDEVSPYEIAYKGYMQTLVESLAEQGGNMIGKGVIGKAIKTISPRLFGKSIGGSMVAGVDRFASSTKNFWDILQKTTNYNGVIDEFLEEEVSNLADPILTWELGRISDNFTIKNQLTTLGAVAMAGVPAHAASAPNIVKGEMRDGKLRKQTNQSIASIENKELRQGVSDALKKGQTIEQKADAISKLNWQDVAPKDAAAIADAFTFNIEREIYKGAHEEMATQNEAAQKVADASMKFSLYRNKDTGLVHELRATDGKHYALMAGSINGKGADDILYVQDIETGEALQMAASNFVGENRISYDQLIGNLTNSLTEKITNETLQQEQKEIEEDAAETGVKPATYAVGEIVELADGRAAQFINYGGDMKSVEVAVEDEATGEVSTIEIGREQIVGLATVEQVEPSNEKPQQVVAKTAPNVQIEIPRKEDGTPNYNEMDGEMFLDEFSKDFSKEDALQEMSEVVALNKQKIERLRKNQSNDMNVRAENKRKIATLEARNNDFEEVLSRNNYGQQTAEETPAEPPKYKTIAEELTAMNSTDYLSLEDYILRDLARGVKFRWADKGTSRGLATMIGHKGKDGERRARIGIIGKDGRGVDEYSESIYSQIESLAIPHSDIKYEMDVRDKVLDVLQRIYSRGQAMTELRKLHTEAPQTIDAQMEQETMWRQDDIMQEKQLEDADYFASLDKPTIEEISKRVGELNQINGANVKVISTETELPEDLQSLVDSEGFDNKGISYQGVAYINAPYADNMADLENTYIHETVGHQLIDTKIPIEGRKTLFGTILKSRSLDQMIEQIPTFVAVADQYNNEQYNELDVAREYVAYLAQTHLTTSDLSAKNKGQHLTFDIEQTVSEQNIIELLKQLSNGIQSVEIRTTRSDQQSDYAHIYSTWRSENFRFGSTNSHDWRSQDSTMGEGPQQRGESFVEGEHQSSIQSSGEEIRGQREQGISQLDLEVGQEVVGRDGTERRATEITSDEIRFREVQNRNNTSQESEKIDAVLQKMAAEFGIESVSVATKRELPLSVRNRSIGKIFKGAYDPTTGKVYFVRSIIESEADAMATFLHEVVAHKGIDGLLGRTKAHKFYATVFNSQTANSQRLLLEQYEGDKIKAGDELVARIAEGNITPGALQRVIAAVRKFLREVLGIKVKISDGDIHYMLFRSKVSLQRAANLTEAMDAIEADGKIRHQIELAQLRMRDRAPLDQVNQQFNEELTALQNGKIRGGHIFSLGMPSIALLSGGVPNLPIELEADRLRKKSKQKEHPFDLSTIKNLPQAIANPIAVFDSKQGADSKIILTEISDGKKNFVVAIRTATNVQRGREVLMVNDVRSLHPRDSYQIIYWINGKLMSWVDKAKAQEFIERQGTETKKSDSITATRLEEMSGIRRFNYAEATSPDGNDPTRALTENRINSSDLNDAANIVQNFENPKHELRFSELEDQKNKKTKHKSGFGIQVQEAQQDATIKVHRLQNEIKAKGGVIDYLTNPYEAINHADSRAQAATERYSKHYIDPIAQMIEVWTKKSVSNYEGVSNYLSAKHSIERHDSGIKALNDEQGWTREETEKIVKEFESAITASEVTALWDAVRAATTELLDISVRSGRISIEDKRDIQSHNWQYYVPLRDKDFDFENIEDIRDVFYIDRKKSGSNDKVDAGQKAKGRTSKATDPISMLLYMASGEIVRSEHNIALRHLLRLVEKYPERTDLFTLKHEWSVKTEFGWKKIKEQPPVEMIRASNAARKALRTEKDPARRAELEKQITVTRREVETDKTYRGGYDKDSKEVVVYKNGIRNIIVLEDLEVAQAFNYRTGEFQNWLANSWLFGKPTRIIAQLSTSKNPAFVLPNFVRDFKNAAQYHFVDSDGNLFDFMGHALTSWRILDRNIRGKANPLTYAEIGEFDILNLDDRKQLKEKYGKDRVNDTLYEMFVVNGGETGYVHIAEAKETERKLRKGIKTKAGHNYIKKGWKGVNNGLDYLANLSENAVRYATFIAQIDNGSSVFDAVTYAKNITVNFNRKGRYSKAIGSAQMFFNASIQAAVNQYSLIGNKQGKDRKTITKQRLRFAVAKTITLMMGVASSALVAKMLSGMGDDDEKYTISDWERLTNFIMPVNGKGYIKIPVAQSERPIYALGVMFNDWMDGKIEASDMVGTFISMFKNAYTPIGIDFDINKDGTADWIKSIIPSAYRPITDVTLFNEDFMGRSINKESYSSSTPDSELGKKDAPEMFKTATKWLNKIGGGNEVTPAGTDRDGKKDARNFLDISPSTIEYILKSYTGGIGRIISDATKLIKADEKEARHIPIANRFYGQFYEKSPSSEYWNIAEAIKFRHGNNRKVEDKDIESTIHGNELKERAKEDALWRNRLRRTDKRIKHIKEQLEEMTQASEEFEQKEKDLKRIQWQFINDYNTQYANAQHD